MFLRNFQIAFPLRLLLFAYFFLFDSILIDTKYSELRFANFGNVSENDSAFLHTLPCSKTAVEYFPADAR